MSSQAIKSHKICDNFINIFFKKIATICGASKSYPHQNVDFVDNMLINTISFFLSTFVLFFVDNLVYNWLIIN